MIHTLSSPAIFSLEITAACNSRCPGCSNVFYQHREQRPPLPLRDWRRILNRIAPHVHYVRVTGGEPTLHPQFRALIAEVEAFGFPFTLFTNALWDAPEQIVDLLTACAHCDGLLISLHGADAAAHEAFSHVPGSFAIVRANIARATDAGLNVVTSTVITQYNYHQMEAIAALSRALGADHATFSRYLGRALPSLEPMPSQLREAIRQVEDLRASGWSVRFGDCIPQCFAPSSSIGCLAGVAYCSIGPWGHLRPCTQADIDCGNLLEIPLSEAWHAPPMQRWRSLVPAACEQECAAFSQCHGGCRATALIRGLKQDPLMTAPLPPEALPPPEPVELYEGLRPVGHYELRKECFGYVLLGPGLSLVSHEAKPLLDRCDGSTTLHEIEALYGQEGLILIAELWRKGLITWASEDQG